MPPENKSAPTGGNQRDAQTFVADTEKVTPGGPAEQPHAVTRALELAQHTSATFGLTDAVNLAFLMERWNARSGCGLDARTIALVVQLALRGGRDTAPITRAEADDIAESAAADFAVLDDARDAVQKYAVLRGADAGQRGKLDVLVRDTWHLQRASGVQNAA